MNGLDDPEVRAWLARLDSEAAVLPDDRRAELRATVEEYLADATAGAGDEERAASRALAELGSPTALVAEAGGYALPPADVVDADDVLPGETGAPWLESSTLALLVASVVLALVPATEAVAPVPWFVGTLLVLLSRRWSVADKALAVGGVRGARCAVRPPRTRRAVDARQPRRVRRARGPLDARRRAAPAARTLPQRGGSRPAHALTRPHGIPPGVRTRRRSDPDTRRGRPPAWEAALVRCGGGGLRSPCHPCRRRRAWPVRPSPACRR